MEKEKIVHYKFRDLKIFGSTEWLANNEKKYRQVYDVSECTFIYCELSFFNKLFDAGEWDVNVNLKCVNHDDESEVCILSAERQIKKDENIVFIREGWGVKTPGTFWKKGNYRWEAWIDGMFIGERMFYIVDVGIVSEVVNPYFTIKTNRLYEASDANIARSERKYLSAFDTKETRYVWLEIVAENLVLGEQPWPCEMKFNFKTHSGQLKGSIEKLFFISGSDSEFECSIGWGSELKSTWGFDNYSIEIIFMDQLIATIPFDVGNEFIEEKEKFKKKPKDDYEEYENNFDTIVNIPDSLKNAFQQYLNSFTEFIKTSYKKQINFNVDKIKKGLHIKFDCADDEFELISNSLIQYVEILENKNTLEFKIDTSLNKDDQNIIMLLLKQQLSFMENNYDLAVLSLERKKETISKLTVEVKNLRSQLNVFRTNTINNMRKLTQANKSQNVKIINNYHAPVQIGGEKNVQNTNYINNYKNNPNLIKIKDILEQFEDMSRQNNEWQESFTNALLELHRLEGAKNKIEEKKSLDKLHKFFLKAKEVKDWVAIGVLPAEIITKGGKMLELSNNLIDYLSNLLK